MIKLVPENKKIFRNFFLYVIPAVYSYFSNEKILINKLFRVIRSESTFFIPLTYYITCQFFLLVISNYVCIIHSAQFSYLLKYFSRPPVFTFTSNNCRSCKTAPIDYQPQSLLPVSILKVFAVIHDTQKYPPSTISATLVLPLLISI